MWITYFGVSKDILSKYIDKLEFKTMTYLTETSSICKDEFSVFVYKKGSYLKNIIFQEWVQIETLF